MIYGWPSGHGGSSVFICNRTEFLSAKVLDTSGLKNSAFVACGVLKLLCDQRAAVT
jgi:hypothetical protein